MSIEDERRDRIWQEAFEEGVRSGYEAGVENSPDLHKEWMTSLRESLINDMGALNTMFRKEISDLRSDLNAALARIVSLVNK